MVALPMKDEVFWAEVVGWGCEEQTVHGFWVGYPNDWAGYSLQRKEDFIKSRIKLWSDGSVTEPFTVRKFHVGNISQM